MKKFISSLLVAATLAVSALGVTVAASETGTNYGKVPATDEKITIDGKKDAIYDKGLTINIDKAENGAATGTTGAAKILWNGKDTWYIYAEIKDKEVILYEGTPNAWETDSLEVFFDYSNKVARTRDQYRLDVKNSATYYDTKTYTGDDTKAFGFEKWAATTIDGGYALEFQIKAYKEPISADMKVGIHFQINDMDKANKRSLYHSDTCYNTPAKFGYVTLSADKVSLPKTTAPSTSAQTADLGVVVSAISLAMTSGALVVLKKRK